MSSIIETKNKKEFQNLSQTGNFIQLFSVGIQWLFGSLGAFQLGLFICLSDKKKIAEESPFNILNSSTPSILFIGGIFPAFLKPFFWFWQ